MSTNRKLRGYIFRNKDGSYYLEYGQGSTFYKLDAHVYSKEEVCRRVDGTWGHRLMGKWQMLYYG